MATGIADADVADGSPPSLTFFCDRKPYQLEGDRIEPQLVQARQSVKEKKRSVFRPPALD